jgi:hypothetical protein
MTDHQAIRDDDFYCEELVILVRFVISFDIIDLI